MKNPSIAKMAKQAGAASPMKIDLSNLKDKAKKAVRKAELFFDQTYYSNKYKAQNPGRFKDAKINQPRFKEEKAELLGPQTLYRVPKSTKSDSRKKLARKTTSRGKKLKQR